MKVVDAKGQNCPIPVIMAKKEIDAGEGHFLVTVDNQTASENLQRLADSQGYRTTVLASGGVWEITFSKDGCPACEQQEKPAEQRASKNGWAVFVGRDTVGEGDPELGRSLMKMFFYTLAQSDDLPGSVLFMNGGVRLPVGDEQVVSHLRDLLEKGVEVLVCGTCLNFYHLTEQLKVGTVSNMYDILSRMQQADKVVSL